jgi:hypothetical protein
VIGGSESRWRRPARRIPVIITAYANARHGRGRYVTSGSLDGGRRGRWLACAGQTRENASSGEPSESVRAGHAGLRSKGRTLADGG